jgi:hypothetical protein
MVVAADRVGGLSSPSQLKPPIAKQDELLVHFLKNSAG